MIWWRYTWSGGDNPGWPALILSVRGLGLRLPSSNWLCRISDSLVGLMVPFFCLAFNAQPVLPTPGHLTGELGSV